MSDERLFVGLMSGTSCDAVDAALVRVDGNGAEMRANFLHLESMPYLASTRGAIAQARQGKLDVGELAKLSRTISERYVDAVRLLLGASGTSASAVAALAAHGQTLFHAPPLTVQAFDPTVLAFHAGIDVVSDFRRADCAAGGQGAPLVPFGDWVLFRHATVPRVILNVGGIANLTFLPAGGELADVTGYDIGPGNCLSDWLMRDHGGFDIGGERAMTGRPIEAVVDAVRAAAFFARPGPKSTDVPQMLGLFRSALADEPDASLADQLATANAIVAGLIVDEVRGVGPGLDQGEIYIAGGGVHNRHIMGQLEAAGLNVRHTDSLGVPTQAREATAFALLAAAHLDRLPCYMPKVTGATRPAILGSLTPASPPSFDRPAPGRSG